MPFRFCTQCGTKLQPEFRFCPSCGEKLPGPADESGDVNSATSLSFSPPIKEDATTSIFKTSFTSSKSFEASGSKGKYCCNTIDSFVVNVENIYSFCWNPHFYHLSSKSVSSCPKKNAQLASSRQGNFIPQCRFFWRWWNSLEVSSP